MELYTAYINIRDSEYTRESVNGFFYNIIFWSLCADLHKGKLGDPDMDHVYYVEIRFFGLYVFYAVKKKTVDDFLVEVRGKDVALIKDVLTGISQKRKYNIVYKLDGNVKYSGLDSMSEYDDSIIEKKRYNPRIVRCSYPECNKENCKRFVCMKCRACYYCNTECQLKHWKAGHKNTCREPVD